MSKARKFTFGIHSVIALIFGVPLLVMPGRFLGLFGWAPVDPLLSRLLGAAMIALAWSSFQGFRTSESSVQILVMQMEVVYTVLGAVGLLRHLLVAWYPWYVWMIFIILVVFGLAWLFFLWKR